MSIIRLQRRFVFTSVLSGLLLASCAVGQTISSITPSNVAAGSGGFVLTVYGNDFDADSVVRLHSSSGVQTLQTYFVNAGLLMAGVTAIEVKNAGNLQVDVATYSTTSSSNLVTLQVTGSGTGSSSGSSGSSSGSGSSSSSGLGPALDLVRALGPDRVRAPALVRDPEEAQAVTDAHPVKAVRDRALDQVQVPGLGRVRARVVALPEARRPARQGHRCWSQLHRPQPTHP